MQIRASVMSFGVGAFRFTALAVTTLSAGVLAEALGEGFLPAVAGPPTLTEAVCAAGTSLHLHRPLWFWSLAALLAMQLASHKLRRTPGLLLSLFALFGASCATAFMVRYTYAELLAGQTCLRCIGVSIVVLLLFVTAVWAPPGKAVPRRQVIVAASCVLVLATLGLFLAHRSGQQARLAAFRRWLSAQSPIPELAPRGQDLVRVVQFQDYQCGACRLAFYRYRSVIQDASRDFPGRVRFEMHDFPLGKYCNEHVATDVHPLACQAAAEVHLARRGGMGEALEQWLFENQGALTPASLAAASRDVGRVADYRQRLDSAMEAVRGDVAFGAALGVVGTPAVFVNGVRLPGLVGPDMLDVALRSGIAVQRSHGAGN